MTVLVDSDILIEVSQGRNAGIIIICSPVSVAELWHGARPEEHGVIANLFQALVCVPIDIETGRKASEFLQKYRKSHGLELGDALIASSAVLNGAALWTRNRKHYPMPGLSFV
ncbi:MAG: type II toxin-antitoxin system VapC family toxin [Bryobacteraceae bacterium]